MKPYVVTFAGIPGTSKSIIAQHLSCTFDLPIFATDVIRYEVKEDLQVSDINLPEALSLYEKRRDNRFTKLLNDKKCFIFDGSQDRNWPHTKLQLEQADFGY